MDYRRAFTGFVLGALAGFGMVTITAVLESREFIPRSLFLGLFSLYGTWLVIAVAWYYKEGIVRALGRRYATLTH